MLMIFLFLRVKHDNEMTLVQKLRRIDYIGNALIVASTIAILYALTYGGATYPWSSWRVIVPLVLGLVGLIAFIGFEATDLVTEPVIPPRLFTNRTSLPVSLGGANPPRHRSGYPRGRGGRSPPGQVRAVQTAAPDRLRYHYHWHGAVHSARPAHYHSAVGHLRDGRRAGLGVRAQHAPAGGPGAVRREGPGGDDGGLVVCEVPGEHLGRGHPRRDLQ